MLAVGTSLASAVAAFASWRSAAKANKTAELLARIETDRRHSELIPQFHLDAEHQRTAGLVYLTVKLIGPSALGRIDKLTISVRDDSTDHRSQLAGGATDVQVAATVWGPYRFSPDIDGATVGGRSVAPITLELGNDRRFQMEPTRPPAWAGDG